MKERLPSADLDTTLLRSFAALAEERHFGRAADRLNISQPALSKRLRRLEALVGGPLLRRGYRDVQLTEPGRTFLERASGLLRETDRVIELGREAVRGEAGRLRIAFGVASMAQLLPEVLRRFRKAHPRVEIEMRDMSSPGQLAALRRAEIDLGFVRLPVRAPEIECWPVLRDRLVAAVGAAAVWREGPGLLSLAEAPFVVCSRLVSASYYDHVVGLCRLAGFAPRIVTETNDLWSLLQLVRAGLGVALVPGAAAVMRVPGVRLRDVRRSEAAWEIGLARRRGLGGALSDRFVAVALEVSAERSGRRRKRT